jgi:hypothetical protein
LFISLRKQCDDVADVTHCDACDPSEIASALEAHGVPTACGGQWTPEQVELATSQLMIIRARHCGGSRCRLDASASDRRAAPGVLIKREFAIAWQMYLV